MAIAERLKLMRSIILGFLLTVASIAAVMLILVPTEDWFPYFFEVEVTSFGICNGKDINSAPIQQISRSQFRSGEAYVCGHLVNISYPKPARLTFFIEPAAGRVIWSEDEIYRFAEGDFFIPVEKFTPAIGSYNLYMRRAKDLLYTVEFEVVP